MELAQKVETIREQLKGFEASGKRVFASSSFQTQSLPLLHILATHPHAIDIVFLDPSYHFPETLSFCDQVAERLKLTVVNVRSSVPKSEQRTSDGRLLFAADTDQCCYLNKIAPLEPYLQSFDVWISGVRADQSVVRANMEKTIPGPHGITRYHPMLDWSAKDIHAYRMHYDLPAHPLESQGYLSVGRMPCTGHALRWWGDAGSRRTLVGAEQDGVRLAHGACQSRDGELMRLFVTGGAGYVGWSVVHDLAQRDGVDEIIIYDNFARRHYGFLLGGKPGGAAKIRVIVDDLLNSRALRKAVEGVDRVIHFASVARSLDIDEKPHVCDQVNHWGTAELGYAVEQAGTPRLVYLSSGAVYGHPDGVADTTTNPLPVNAYGRSKLAGERQLERLTSQLQLRIIRSGTVYGVNPAARFDTFVNRFLLDAALGRSLNVNGSGEQVRPIVPVDVVAARVVDAAMGHESTAISHTVTESIAVNHVIESLKAIDASLDVIYINQQQRLGGLTMTSAPDHITRGVAQTPSLAERLETDLGRLALNGASG